MSTNLDMWEYFFEEFYYGLWAVRNKQHRGFNEAIHVRTKEEAEFLVEALNERDKLRSMCVAAANEIEKHWDAHCDEDGYGPINLLDRLKGKAPADYYVVCNNTED